MPFVQSANANIYYEVHGAGPAIVFAHGAGGNAASWWQQVPHFVRGNRIITFDHRTFGRSTCAPEDFRAKNFARDVLAILDAEGIDRAALVCQSMGGWAGSRLAVEHAERVRALVMSHTPGCFSNPQIAQLRDAAPPREAPAESFAHWAVGAEFPRRKPAESYLYTQIAGLNVSFDRALLTRLRENAALIDTSSLGDYRVPTLFITTDKDRIFSPELIRTTANAVPGAEFLKLGDAGHSSYFEIPEAFNQVVEDFLARN